MDSNARLLRIRLVVLCFLMLFVELALIRWLGGNVLYLAYFSNIVLLGSFLGIGLGFLWAKRSEVQIYKFAPLALAALVVFVHNVPVTVVSTGGDLIFFGAELKPSGPPRELALPAVFLAVAFILACIGNGIAHTFRQLKNLDAYQFDLIGSLIGIVGFAVLSFVGAPPIVWGIIVTVVFVWTLWPRQIADGALLAIPLLILLATWGVESREENVLWTPYYKANYLLGDSGAGVLVNGVPHWFQTSDEDWPLYLTLYERRASSDPVEDLLVIGSGSGNDVAVALANGAQHVDAVEIDHRLLDLAKKYHPNDPYGNSRVDTHVDDGRAYLERANKSWDQIVLALPDSLTLVQGASSIRLESYLFTVEAAEAYREHLTDDGVFAMYNLYRESWLVDRYAQTLTDAFGHEPCMTKLEGTVAVLVVGVDPSAVDCPPGEQWVASVDAPEPVSDNRPFPYLKTPSIPTFYVVALGLILLASVVLVRLVGGPMGAMRSYADLFFMGVAFMLLETKNIVQFALLFGTTWFVNALVFSGVIASVLLAVVVSKRVRVKNLNLMYGLLAISIVIGWLIPQNSLLPLGFWPRLLAACAIAFAPIFIANVIFSQRFRDAGDSMTGFAANLIGAMVGGVLEYTALVLGYRNLLIVALLLYTAAFLSGRRTLAAST
ncbi:MAG: spermidine synthase [Actinomycetota bacterium]|nr:spermidine synthase [Actinomycetota bacterium]MDA3012700.1 spermidine synthase [Actinomycetota bacterium]MDA3025598.1 spermidine synthase [Actinomycetota bacterium]